MDLTKSLAELSGKDWGPAPASASFLMRERHEFRRTPLRELSDAGLIRLLEIGGDEELLVPLALDRLVERPEAGALLCAVLAADGFPWRARSDFVAHARAAASAVLNDLGTITDDLDRLAHVATVYRSLVGFEERLSIFPPARA